MSTREERARKLAAKHIVFARSLTARDPWRNAERVLDEATQRAARNAAIYLAGTYPGALVTARDEARAFALLDDRLPSTRRRRRAGSGGHGVR